MSASNQMIECPVAAMMESLLYCCLFFVLLACADTKQPGSAEDAELVSASLQKAGLDSSLIQAMDSNVANGTYPNIHSVLIWKDNQLVFEKYYPGHDQIWGDDIGNIVFTRDSLHDIRSVTKSIVGACIGIAIAQRKINSVNQRVFDFYPEYKQLDTGLKSTLTIKHLLTMTTGQVWNEDVPYSDSANSEIKMINSPDPVKFALAEPLEKVPGTSWKYNGGSTQVLASIIEKATGKRVDQFADEYLFKPLGINRYTWIMYPGTRLPAAASGLRLTPRDLIRFGVLYLNNGVYNGRNIIPAAWVSESMQMHFEQSADQNNRNGYGYQFWLRSLPSSADTNLVAIAIGNGNQRVFIDRPDNTVVVITAGNYNNWSITNNSDKLVEAFIYPAINKP